MYKKVIDPKEYRYSNKPLSRELWSGIIDTVGGDVLSSFLTEIKYNGIAVSTGLAKSHELNTTVFHELRNITLAGIDCVYAPYIKRVNAWKFLEKNLDKKILENIQTSKDLNKIKEICTKIINRQVMGRILIKRGLVLKINTNNYAEVTQILQEISTLASKKINEIYSDDVKEFRRR